MIIHKLNVDYNVFASNIMLSNKIMLFVMGIYVRQICLELKNVFFEIKKILNLLVFQYSVIITISNCFNAIYALKNHSELNICETPEGILYEPLSLMVHNAQQ